MKLLDSIDARIRRQLAEPQGDPSFRYTAHGWEARHGYSTFYAPSFCAAVVWLWRSWWLAAKARYAS